MVPCHRDGFPFTQLTMTLRHMHLADLVTDHRAQDLRLVRLDGELVPRLLSGAHFDGHLAEAVGREPAWVEALANGLAHGRSGA